MRDYYVRGWRKGEYVVVRRVGAHETFPMAVLLEPDLSDNIRRATHNGPSWKGAEVWARRRGGIFTKDNTITGGLR